MSDREPSGVADRVEQQVLRYSERRELWKDTGKITREVWPEYNLHSEDSHGYWDRLFDEFPEFQFLLYNSAVREVVAKFQGGGLANRMLDVMSEIGRGAGLRHLIAPVRPSLKDRYPITPIEQYATWTRDNGEPFDPWIRIHIRRGGRIVKPIPNSMRITGTGGHAWP